MVIAHNISALNTYKSLGIAGNSMQSSMEKLSSGYKINKAGDDAAGLSISEKMRSQIRGLNQASTNAENGVSMIQTAEGALNEQHSILQRMRELAVQAATDTNADEDREALQSEMNQLSNEINRIGQTTEFNGMKILNGDKASTVTGGTAKKTVVTFTNALTDSQIEEINNKVKDATVTFDNAQKVVTVTFDTVASADELAAQATRLTAIKADLNSITGQTGDASDTAGAAGTLNDKSVYFHVGANSNQVINTNFNDMRAKSLGITFSAAPDVDARGVAVTGVANLYTSTAVVNDGISTTPSEYSLNISNRAGANNAIQAIDDAIKKVSEERSKYGAIQNRLEYTMNNLNTTAENMTAAESTIRDVDMAEEMMEYTKNNILQQAAQAMLVQANARPQQALQLLQ